MKIKTLLNKILNNTMKINEIREAEGVFFSSGRRLEPFIRAIESKLFRKRIFSNSLVGAIYYQLISVLPTFSKYKFPQDGRRISVGFHFF